MIYVNKIDNRIMFKIKTGYYLEHVTSKSNITKDKNGENVSHLSINEVVLIYCSIVNNDLTRVLHAFVPTKSFGQLLDISP